MGRIIIPERKKIVSGRLHSHISMAGKFRFQIRKARSKRLVEDTGWMDNLITDVGLYSFITMPSYGAYDSGAIACNVAVGTGNTTPATTDTSLAHWVASAGGTGANGGGTGFPSPNATGYVAAASPTPAYWYARYIYQFGTGAAAGNLTEVGAFPGGTSPATNLFSRALIVDGLGNPTSITVLSDEILTVTYELRYYIDQADHAFSFNLNGSPVTGTYRTMYISQVHAAINRPASIVPNVSLYSGDIQPTTGSAPSGSLGSINNNVSPPTVVQKVNDIANSGTCYIDWRGTFGSGNGTGTISSISFDHHMWSYQFGHLSAPIIKTSGQQLQVNFRESWGRYP